ncbi:MAG: recombinase family protein [Eggerthellaceae bacterium]|nr:recombinase family protein [Eggerthellaceae bacterium]
MARNKQVNQNDNNSAIAYYRFSSSAQNEASIEQQRDAAHRYARGKGLIIVREYEDRAISGKTSKRPGYQQMLAEISEIKPAFLITWKNDRLGRDRAELAIAKKKIRSSGCRIEFVAEASPEEGSTGVILDGLLDTLSQFYSDQLSENVRRGHRYNAERALSNGHKILGYKVGDDKRYIPDPDKAPVVQKIFNDYAEGKPLQEIADELNSHGVRTSAGGRFTINGLRGTLHNRAYIGVYKYADVIIEGGMPQLVPTETFEKVQRRFNENKRAGRSRMCNCNGSSLSRYWLTGKLFCGMCGNSLQGMSGTSKTGAIHYYYGCKNRRKGNCKKEHVKKVVIERVVTDLLLEILANDENRAMIAVDAVEYYKMSHSNSNGYLESLEAELKSTETALSNIVRAIEQGIFSETTQNRLTELEFQKSALLDALACEKAKQELTRNERAIQEHFSNFAQEDLSDDAIRDKVLEYFVDAIYLFDDHVDVVGSFFGNKISSELEKPRYDVQDFLTQLAAADWYEMELGGDPDSLFAESEVSEYEEIQSSRSMGQTAEFDASRCGRGGGTRTHNSNRLWVSKAIEQEWLTIICSHLCIEYCFYLSKIVAQSSVLVFYKRGYIWKSSEECGSRSDWQRAWIRRNPSSWRCTVAGAWERPS